MVAITGAALILPLRAIFPDCGSPRGPLASDPIQLKLLVASQKRDLVNEIVQDFHGTSPHVDGRCIKVVEVTKMTSGDAEAGLREAALDHDVWMPSAMTWVETLKEKAPGLFPTGKQVPSINTTPEVIAMPHPMAMRLGWPRGSIGWETIYERARNGWNNPDMGWGPFRLLRTDPNRSTSGLYSTISAYYAAKSAALKAGSECTTPFAEPAPNVLTKHDVDHECIKRFVRDVESSVLYYGESSLDMLPDLAAADRRNEPLNFASALMIQEVSLVNYNLGSPTGEALSKQLRKQKKDLKSPSVHGRLAAIYPTGGTLYADQPYAILERRSEKKIQAAQKLEEYLRADPKGKFKQAGFRHTNGTGDEKVLSEKNGIPEVRLDPYRLPEPDVVIKIMETWKTLRKAARVLVLVDVADPSPAAEAVKEALKAALDHLQKFASHQEVGLWLVTGQAAGGPGYDTVADIKPVGAHRPPLADRVQVSGGNSLDGPLQAASTSFTDGDFINVVVVLTDGYDTKAFNVESLKQVFIEANRQRGVRLFPVAFGAAGEGTQACDQLTAVAAASRTTASETTPYCIGANTPTIKDVLMRLVKRF